MERALTFRPAPGAEAKARPRGQSNDHKTGHVWFHSLGPSGMCRHSSAVLKGARSRRRSPSPHDVDDDGKPGAVRH